MGYAKLRAENPTDVEMDDTTFLEKVRRFKYPNLSPEKMRAMADAYESGGGGTPTAAKAPPASSPTGKLSQTPLGAVPVLGQVIRGAEAVQAAGGPLGAIEATTRHAGREASDIFGGIGQLLTGIPYAGGLAARNFGRAVGLPENVDPTLAAETQQATRSFGKVAKAMPGEIAGQFVREGYDPGKAFIEKPVTTGLDMMMLAGLPSMGAKVGSRVAAMAGKEAAAKAAATAAETMRPMAVVKTAIREAGEREPFIKGMVERSAQIGKARDLVATSAKHAATVSEAESARLERAFQGLTKQEREVATSVVAGTSQLRPESEIAPRFLHDVSLNETSRQRITRAVDAYKQGIEAEQAKRIARGELTSEIIKRRAGQEQRLAFGGEQAAALEAAPRRVINTDWMDRRVKSLSRDLAVATEKAAPRAAIEGELRALDDARKTASATERQYASVVAKLRALRGRHGEAGRFTKSIEAIQTELDNLEDRRMATGSIGDVSKTANKMNAIWRKVGRLEQQTKTSYQALGRMMSANKRASVTEQTRAINDAVWNAMSSAPAGEEMAAGKLAQRRAIASARVGAIVDRAREAEARGFAYSIEDIQRDLDALETQRRSAARPGDWLSRRTGQFEQQARTAQKAGARQMNLGSQISEAEAEKFAINYGRQSPASILSRMGTARNRLNIASAAERKAGRIAPKMRALEQQAEASRGVVPVERAMDWQNAYYRSIGMPAPTYVPGMPKKMTIRQLIGNLRGPTGEAPTPGFLKRSTGATYLSGESERDLGRLAAKHSEVSIRNDRNIEISRGIPKLPGVRPIKSIGEVDWTKESLFAPGMYARNVSQAIQEGGDVLASALKSRDAVGELDKGFRATLIKEPGQAAQAMGPFYAVPKAVAKEITGQLKGGGPLWSRILFDTPNTFQRWAVLTLRPGFYVNNVVGGTGLAALSGGKPSAFIRALKPSVIAQMPEELRGSGFAAVEAPSAGGGVLQPIAKASGILNEQVDEYFRRVAFLSDVDRRAAAQAVKQTGKLLERGLSYAQKAERLGPGGIEESVKYVNRFFNDYTRQSPRQRQVLRRVFPFQSFVTHMARLATRLPLQHPMRADLLAKATQLANDYRDDRFAQAGHTNLPAYRTSQFPILAQPGGGMTTFGTQGFNPTSGLGTSSAEFQAAPGVGALSEAAAGQAGIAGRTALEQIFGRQIGTGRAFTSPDVIESYGGGLSRRNPDTGKMIPSGTPRPGLADVVRENLPLASLLEKLRVPNDTYDLWGGFQGFGGPIETGTGAGEVPRPRRYSGREALLAYLGLPVRGFESAELEYPESVKKALQAADAEDKRRQAARKRKKEAK